MKLTRAKVVEDLRQARDVVDRLLVAAKRGALDPCDCRHSSIEHGLVHEGPAAGSRPCLVAGCDCIHFDDSGQQVTELARKTRVAEEDAADWERRKAAA